MIDGLLLGVAVWGGVMGGGGQRAKSNFKLLECGDPQPPLMRARQPTPRPACARHPQLRPLSALERVFFVAASTTGSRLLVRRCRLPRARVALQSRPLSSLEGLYFVAVRTAFKRELVSQCRLPPARVALTAASVGP